MDNLREEEFLKFKDRLGKLIADKLKKNESEKS